MKRALTLLLFVACAGAKAQAPVAAGAIGCDTPIYQPDPDGLVRASQALASARTAPGPQDLALAGALADLAYATVRQQAPMAQRDANRKAALDMVERAQAIWNAAPASAGLAQELLRRAAPATARWR